jgi:hypothetical protein
MPLGLFTRPAGETQKFPIASVVMAKDPPEGGQNMTCTLAAGACVLVSST